MVEFLMAMARNAALIFWAITLICAPFLMIAAANNLAFRWEWNSRAERVKLFCVVVICAIYLLASATVITESFKASTGGC